MSRGDKPNKESDNKKQPKELKKLSSIAKKSGKERAAWFDRIASHHSQQEVTVFMQRGRDVPVSSWEQSMRAEDRSLRHSLTNLRDMGRVTNYIRESLRLGGALGRAVSFGNEDVITAVNRQIEDFRAGNMDVIGVLINHNSRVDSFNDALRNNPVEGIAPHPRMNTVDDLMREAYQYEMNRTDTYG